MTNVYRNPVQEAAFDNISKFEKTNESIDNVISWLDRRIHVLELTKMRIRGYINTQKAIVAPIARISTDILIRILSYLIAEAMRTKSSPVRDRRNLMGVCRSWRTLILQCQSFWSYCCFDGSGVINHALAFRQWTIRSGTSPLQVSVQPRLQFSGSQNALMHWKKFAMPNLKRLDSVHFGWHEHQQLLIERRTIGRNKSKRLQSTSEETYTFFKSIEKAPRLSHLNINLAVYSPLSNDDEDTITTFPRLQVVTFVNTIIRSLDIRAPQLHTAHICWSHCDLSFIYLLLKNSPLLHELRFRGIEVYLQEDSWEPFTHQSLRRLHVDSDIFGKYRHSIGILQTKLLQMVSYEHLTGLTLSIFNLEDAQLIPMSQLSNLKSFGVTVAFSGDALDSLFAFCIVLAQWLQSLTRLQELILSSSVDLPLDPLLICLLASPKSDAKPVCEGLRTLQLIRGAIVFPEIIRKVFTERSNNGNLLHILLGHDDDNICMLRIMSRNSVITHDSWGNVYPSDWRVECPLVRTHRAWEADYDLELRSLERSLLIRERDEDLSDLFDIDSFDKKLEILQVLVESEGWIAAHPSDTPETDSESEDGGEHHRQFYVITVSQMMEVELP